MRKAHIICCNDAIKAAILDDKDLAESKMSIMKEEYFDKHQITLEDKDTLYWHIHTVDIL